MRTCIASGEQKPKDRMVRFVIGPNDEVVPDLEEKLPGKGLWLSADRQLIDYACAKNLFAKKARRSVRVEAGLAARVEDLLLRRCLDLLHMARRAGSLIFGHDEVCRRIESGHAGLLIAASDAAASGRDRVQQRAGALPVVGGLNGDELGRVFDRERVVHAVVDRGRQADRIGRDLTRLSGLRPPADAPAT